MWHAPMSQELLVSRRLGAAARDTARSSSRIRISSTWSSRLRSHEIQAQVAIPRLKPSHHLAALWARHLEIHECATVRMCSRLSRHPTEELRPSFRWGPTPDCMVAEKSANPIRLSTQVRSILQPRMGTVVVAIFVGIALHHRLAYAYSRSRHCPSSQCSGFTQNTHAPGEVRPAMDCG